mgnify:CR=1 FL=1
MHMGPPKLPKPPKSPMSMCVCSPARVADILLWLLGPVRDQDAFRPWHGRRRRRRRRRLHGRLRLSVHLFRCIGASLWVVGRTASHREERLHTTTVRWMVVSVALRVSVSCVAPPPLERQRRLSMAPLASDGDLSQPCTSGGQRRALSRAAKLSGSAAHSVPTSPGRCGATGHSSSAPHADGVRIIRVSRLPIGRVAIAVCVEVYT